VVGEAGSIRRHHDAATSLVLRNRSGRKTAGTDDCTLLLGEGTREESGQEVPSIIINGWEYYYLFTYCAFWP
jgi:hypothetical protein